MKILLLEYNRMLSRALVRGLEEEGITVSLANDLPDAKRLAETQSYDVIVLDLPPQIELAVLRHWRRAGISSPVLFLSIPGNRSDRRRDLDLSPLSFLAKPFRFEKLLSEVRSLGALCSYADPIALH